MDHPFNSDTLPINTVVDPIEVATNEKSEQLHLIPESPNLRYWATDRLMEPCNHYAEPNMFVILISLSYLFNFL